MLFVCSIFADILIDVYAAFCSDGLKLRNFHIDVMNLTTIDVLWDVSTLDVPCLVWHTFGAYNVVFIITYIGVGFALSVLECWAMRRPQIVERQQSSSTFFLCRFVKFSGTLR